MEGSRVWCYEPHLVGNFVRLLLITLAAASDEIQIVVLPASRLWDNMVHFIVGG